MHLTLRILSIEQKRSIEDESVSKKSQGACPWLALENGASHAVKRLQRGRLVGEGGEAFHLFGLLLTQERVRQNLG